MTKMRHPAPRILVGASSFVDAAAALRVVEGLARGVGAGLGGVLVEEVNTLAICEIPNQRVVLVSGATMLAPNKSQVRSLMEADARAFQQSLARTAKVTGAEWVFAQEVGDLVSTALRVAVDWDILVIGYRHVHAIPGKIVLLAGGDATSDDMETAARVLAQQLSADQIVFSVGPEIEGEDTIQTASRSQFGTLQEALTSLSRTNTQAVLVDLAHGPIGGPDDLARLLEVSRCPLIVFGASEINPMLEHNPVLPAPRNGDHTGDL